MNPVVIFGTGELAECVYYYLTKDSEYKVTAFTKDRDHIKSDTFLGLPIVPFEEIQTICPPDNYDMFIAVGYQELNAIRRNKFNEAKEKGYKLISYISSKAITWDNLKIGENCFVGENNVIHPFVTMEDNIFMWSSNLIGHHTYISSNCFFTCQVVIAGGVNIGENCFFGINSSIRNYVNIAKNCIIGANSFITNNTQEDSAFITEGTKLSRMPSSMLKRVINTRKR